MNTSNLRRLVLLGLVGVALTNCSTGPEPTYTIRGTVTDSISGVPIDSAQIIVGDTISSLKMFYSGKQGNYLIHPDTVGSVQLYCRKENYKTKVKTVDLAVNKFTYSGVDFNLAK